MTKRGGPWRPTPEEIAGDRLLWVYVLKGAELDPLILWEKMGLPARLELLRAMWNSPLNLEERSDDEP